MRKRLIDRDDLTWASNRFCKKAGCGCGFSCGLGFPIWAVRDSFDGEIRCRGRPMSQPRDDRQDDLFRPPLEEIINLRHPLVRLAGKIDWNFLTGRFRSVCRVGPGQPPLPTRLVAGLLILKHMHNLSDEALCDRWVENPYFQYFCGEVVFRHELPFDRSSLTRWRQRLGEEQIVALLQESLSVAHRTGAIDTKDLERVAIDTTVQEKAIAHPTDARLTHRAIEKLVELAKREGVELRQSYLRLAKRAAIMVGRYTHAHQFKRARRELKFLRTLAASSVIFAARSRATQRSKTALACCSISRCGFAIKSSVSAAQRSTRCTRPRSSASRARRTSSVVRFQLPLRSPRPRAGSSCFMPRHCTATQMMAILSVPSSPISKSLQVSRSAASTATRAIAATTIRTGSRSGSAAKSGVSPRPSAARCAGAPPSNPSSATSRRITAWAATISPAAMAIASTPCSPLPATTSACSCAGSRSFYASFR